MGHPYIGVENANNFCEMQHLLSRGLYLIWLLADPEQKHMF